MMVPYFFKDSIKRLRKKWKIKLQLTAFACVKFVIIKLMIVDWFHDLSSLRELCGRFMNFLQLYRLREKCWFSNCNPLNGICRNPFLKYVYIVALKLTTRLSNEDAASTLVKSSTPGLVEPTCKIQAELYAENQPYAINVVKIFGLVIYISSPLRFTTFHWLFQISHKEIGI